MMKSPVWRWVATIGILGILLYVFDPLHAAEKLAAAAPALLFWSVIGVFVNLLLNATAYYAQLWRIRKIPFTRVMESVMRSWIVESVTPGKLGSFAVAWFWQKEGLSLGQGAAIALSYRVSLGILVLLFGVVGSYWVFPFVNQQPLMVVGLILGVLLAGSGLFLFRSTWQKLLPLSWIKKLSGFTLAFQTVFLQPPIFVSLLLMGTIQLGITSLIFQQLFAIAGYSVEWTTVLVATSLVQLAALAPISINGIGIREGLMAVLLENVGVPSSVTIVVSGINTATGYVLAFIFSIFWARVLIKKNDN
ncbi:MAG: flippase-like domain-containing protein [Candidatus Diapherotrites archaeon]|uniref:Flippase-like domain-containing protein n=1 Tax=Candidatus Iainarchaeum sp. TaxID=3101447 RepID=A0A8T4C735_9ARCH|nr:flippase-like domain-containing protein [Candidatus Diapherotrites archaeon]